VRTTLASTLAVGTRPHSRESTLAVTLSPSTARCPAGSSSQLVVVRGGRNGDRVSGGRRDPLDRGVPVGRAVRAEAGHAEDDDVATADRLAVHSPGQYLLSLPQRRRHARSADDDDRVAVPQGQHRGCRCGDDRRE
jgi:hypothetical protein